VTAGSGGSIEDLVARMLRRTPRGRLAAATSVLKALIGALESGEASSGVRRRVQV